MPQVANTQLPDPPEWHKRALCKESDPEAWFPEGQGASAREAKRICRRCPVQGSCLAYALEHNELGVWGGLAERERRKLKRRRAAAGGGA